MIPEAHAHFLRWAAWVKAPVTGIALGYGPSILAKIIEGKGRILPGGRGVASLDPLGAQVQRFVDGLDRRDRLLVKVFYLDGGQKTVEERAERLKMPVRTLYDRLERIHALYLVVAQQWGKRG